MKTNLDGGQPVKTVSEYERLASELSALKVRVSVAERMLPIPSQADLALIDEHRMTYSAPPTGRLILMLFPASETRRTPIVEARQCLDVNPRPCWWALKTT